MALRMVLASLLLATTWINPIRSQAAITHTLDIPAQGLGPALAAFAQQTGLQLVYPAALVEGYAAESVSGNMTPEEALAALLAGTELRYEFIDARTVTLITDSSTSSLRRDGDLARFAALSTELPAYSTAGQIHAPGIRLAQVDEGTSSAKQSGAARDKTELQEVVVTGTRIRGAQPSSPVVTITQEEMRVSGHNDLGEVIRALPQNFGGGQNPEVAQDAGEITNQNLTGGSSLNLRGLGPDATLTLLNGARLPYDGLFQATDITVIPVAAIERLEVLLDGASALYGSDAVGGVANIILKRDYDGVELAARYGGATDGGYTQTQYTGVAGTTWDSGGFLITGDHARNTGVQAGQRDYLGYMPKQDVSLYPPLEQTGGLFSGHQALGDSAELALDAFYAQRETTKVSQGGATTSFTARADSTIWGVSPVLRFDLPGEWSLRTHGFVGRNEVERESVGYFIATGAQRSQSFLCYCNEAAAAGVEAEGRLFTLPGGEVRLSVGAGQRRNTFENINLITGVTSTEGTSRSDYGYGEIDLPLVSQEQDIPFITRLSLNGAGRHEKYNTFGDVTTPKIGMIWGVTPDLDIRASWGKSFKVPTLNQQYTTNVIGYNRATVMGASGVPADATVLNLVGGNTDLSPERAEIVTAGFALRPQFAPGLNVELGWFHISYADRVVQPVTFSQALSDPVFAPFVTLNPTVEQQAAVIAMASVFNNFAGAPYDPADVIAIVDSRYANVTAQKAKGVDVSVNYTTDLLAGRITASANASWLDGRRKITELSPEFATTGVIFFPAEFRGRFGTTWSREGLTLASYVNHVDGLKNTNITPNPRGASMTTLDLVIDYQMESDVVGDIGFNLAVMNLFNQEPPFMQPSQPFFVNYDSTNYSAIGRVVSATVTKRF